ncbi:calmodulin-A [Lutzomyia longipalpis]|uniref:calmodulin-A n=1 Tax=Lutzomyia longipalpis TaxID=7200 RepID=UPI002483E9B6|nr:calmodulin-A [Lutzomyia longipalpis]
MTRQASDRPDGDDPQNPQPPPESQSSPPSGSQNVSTDEPPQSASPNSEGNVFFGSRPRTTEMPGKRRLISKNQMRDFREAFRLFDKDGDGSITKEELGSVMRSLGQFARVEELKEMLQEIDMDGDGNVSFEEFVDIMSNMTDTAVESSADQEERELRDAFRVFDKHNRGYITASDLRAVLQCLGEDLDEDEIEDMIKEVDVDGDGRIDFYEFVSALGEPEDSQDNEEEDEAISPLPTPLPIH